MDCELQPFGRWKVMKIHRTHRLALSFDRSALAITFPSAVLYTYYNIICIYRLQWRTEGGTRRIRRVSNEPNKINISVFLITLYFFINRIPSNCCTFGVVISIAVIGGIFLILNSVVV